MHIFRIVLGNVKMDKRQGILSYKICAAYLQTPQRILAGLAMYSAMCTLPILFYCTIEIFRYPTLSSTPPTSSRSHCVNASGTVTCRLLTGPSVGRGSLDVGPARNNSRRRDLSAAEAKPSLRIVRPDRWIGPKGYVTYKDKKVSQLH